MAQTLSGDANNDIYLDSNGDIAIDIDAAAVLNDCRTAAQARLGEMILQSNLGVPYFETVFNGNPNVPQYQAALIKTLLGVENVIQVQALSVVISGGVLKYSATIQTSFGTGDINGNSGL